MGVRATNYVWEHSPSKGGRLLVLLALGDRANDDFVCWPGVKELAKKSRLSTRQVERVLKELHKDGEIEYPPNRPTKDSPVRIRQNVGPTRASGDDDARVEADPTRASDPPVEPSGEPSKEPSTRERVGLEVQEVWAAYLQATGKTGLELNDKRRKIIENGLKVAIAEDQAGRLAKCKRAVVGLSLSPHHNGENESGTQYLDIRYALKGIRDESDDERIERMAAIAAQQGVSAANAKVDPARVERRLEDIRSNRSSGGTWEPERARRAAEDLQAWGFTVVLLEEAPWAKLEQGAP